MANSWSINYGGSNFNGENIGGQNIGNQINLQLVQENVYLIDTGHLDDVEREIRGKLDANQVSTDAQIKELKDMLSIVLQDEERRKKRSREEVARERENRRKNIKPSRQQNPNAGPSHQEPDTKWLLSDDARVGERIPYPNFGANRDQNPRLNLNFNPTSLLGGPLDNETDCHHDSGGMCGCSNS